MRIAGVMVTALILLMAASGLVAAQDLTGKFALNLDLGLVAAAGDFADEKETIAATGGLAGAGSIEYYFNDNIAVGGKMVVDIFDMDTDDLEEYVRHETGYHGLDVEGIWGVVEISGHIKTVYPANQPARIFGRAGLIMGKTFGTIEISAMGQSEDLDLEMDMAMGLDLAVGGMYLASDNIGLYGEFGLVHLLTDGKDLTLEAMGDEQTGEYDINHQWFAVKAGITIFLGGK